MGYLGAYVDDGFSAPLLFQVIIASSDLRSAYMCWVQIAEEVQQLFGSIFRGHPLKYTWGYKYTSEMKGINVHADQARVNVNWWLTPDEANMDSSSGGLTIHKAEAPAQWEFEKYNGEDAEANIRAYLKQSNKGSVTIPHKRNRVVLFDSSLFHETDKFKFKKGYKNMRINVTMLFGKSLLNDSK